MRRLRALSTRRDGAPAALVALLVALVLLVATLTLFQGGLRRAGTATDLVATAGEAALLAQAAADTVRSPTRAAPPEVDAAAAALAADARAALASGVLDDGDAAALRDAVAALTAAAREEARLRATGDDAAADALRRDAVEPALLRLETLLRRLAVVLESAAARDRSLAAGSGAAVVALVGGVALWTQRRISRLYRSAIDTARFEAVVAGSVDVILVSDLDGVVGYASPVTTTVLGVRPWQWAGVALAERLDPRDAPAVGALAGRAVAAPGTAHGGRVRMPHADGHQLQIELLVHAVATSVLPSGERGLVWTLRDVTGAHVMEERLRRIAFYDEPTGLPNRVLLTDRLEKLLARLRPGGAAGAVVLLDLDRFRDVVDVHGRAEGDRVVSTAVERLRAELAAGQMLARVGSNAFVAVLDDVVGADEALAAATRLTGAVSGIPAVAAAPDYPVGCSAGVVLLDDATDAETVLRDAFTALHAAKASGGRAMLFEEDMHARAAHRLELLAGLPQAVEAGELELAYQPVVDLTTGQVTGVEALLRWNHPRLGRVAPDAFVALAEEGGAIDDIGAWVVRSACGQAADWVARLGPRAPGLVSVNLSPHQLGSSRIVDEVAAALAATGLPASTLVLEITESALARDGELAALRLGELKALGVRLALDDFGTGYSSFASLQQFPLDVLKVDRSFLADPDETVLRSICSLGASLGLRTVVEGVESPDQARLLRSIGCDAAQGFLFAPPGPAAQVEVMLGTTVLDGVDRRIVLDDGVHAHGVRTDRRDPAGDDRRHGDRRR